MAEPSTSNAPAKMVSSGKNACQQTESCGPATPRTTDPSTIVTIVTALSNQRQVLGTAGPWETRFQPGDFFVFGSEARGLPESLLRQHPDRVLRIPMRHSSTRSLNLATSAAITLYEAWRQNSALPGG